ncbi:MAG: ribosome biogenesis GTP-binding protein YihA/YsxC [Holosporales bacterium]|nr:ribosome biogenesis GTP-binding protein YihA/YsxC [Holosporales bacterium]
MDIVVKGQPQFLFSVADACSLPDHDYNEVAFFGASNVGKSSIINAVCNQKNLAKTSKTPGRTQLLNFFTFPPGSIIVDVPGYGFADIPDEARRHWQRLLVGYLESRSARLHAYLLLDSRRFIRPNDMDLIRIFQQYEISFTFVMTKVDKLNKTEQKELKEKIAEQFGNSCDVVITSVKDRIGIDELKQSIYRP